MDDRFIRTSGLIGEKALDKLKNSHVAVFGAGGVGGYAIEALARSGIGKLTIIDGDEVSRSNINRQIIALESNVGVNKAAAEKNRIADINPSAEVIACEFFYTAENSDEIDFLQFDYVVDAIDMVASKILIIEKCKEANVRVISAMGAGNKLDPLAFEVTDISKTSVCPLARVMRRELGKRGITNVKVVYSKEERAKGEKSSDEQEKRATGRPVPASIAFVPSAMGLIIASEIVKDLIDEE